MRRGAARHHPAVRVQALRARAARPSTPSDRAWSPRRARAPRTTASPTTGRPRRAHARRPDPARPRFGRHDDAASSSTRSSSPDFDDDALKRLDDAASLPFPGSRIAMSTDTYVVHPLFFPGGDIGRLAVCGTVNDVATSGATPLYLSVGFVLEEGFPIADLKRDPRSRCATPPARPACTSSPATPRSSRRATATACFINTAGVGVLAEGVDLSGSNCKPGDKVLLSGTLGDHGIAIVSTREGLEFSTSIETDAAPLNAAHRQRACRCARRPLLPRPHPRRPRLHAQRTRRRLRRLDHGQRDDGAGERPGARRERDARLRRVPGRQRGQDGRRRPRRAGRGRTRRDEGVARTARRPRSSARSPRAPPARCTCTRASARLGSWTCSSASSCRGSARVAAPGSAWETPCSDILDGPP